MDTDNNENWREILSRIEGKIDQLEEDVKKIHKQVHPAWWKKLARFIVDNFFTVLTFVSLVLIAWKALEFYQNIAEQLEIVKDLPNKALNSVQGIPRMIDSVKSIPQDAANNSLDSIKGFIKNIKF